MKFRKTPCSSSNLPGLCRLLCLNYEVWAVREFANLAELRICKPRSGVRQSQICESCRFCNVRRTIWLVDIYFLSYVSACVLWQPLRLQRPWTQEELRILSIAAPVAHAVYLADVSFKTRWNSLLTLKFTLRLRFSQKRDLVELMTKRDLKIFHWYSGERAKTSWKSLEYSSQRSRSTNLFTSESGARIWTDPSRAVPPSRPKPVRFGIGQPYQTYSYSLRK